MIENTNLCDKTSLSTKEGVRRTSTAFAFSCSFIDLTVKTMILGK